MFEQLCPGHAARGVVLVPERAGELGEEQVQAVLVDAVHDAPRGLDGRFAQDLVVATGDANERRQHVRQVPVYGVAVRPWLHGDGREAADHAGRVAVLRLDREAAQNDWQHSVRLLGHQLLQAIEEQVTMLVHLGFLELGKDPRDDILRGALPNGGVQKGDHHAGGAADGLHVVDDGLPDGGDEVVEVRIQQLPRRGVDELGQADAHALADVRVACGQVLHEDRHQLGHHALAQLADEVADATRRDALLLAVRGREAGDQSCHQRRQQLLERARRILHHGLPNLRARLLHHLVLVAPDDVERGQHVRPPLPRQLLALHELRALRRDPVRTKELLDELAHELHRGVPDAPVRVKYAVLQRFQEHRRVRRAELLGQDLGSTEGRVPHRRDVV
mmetsp:Transcript_63242/g.193457  ORF Transcript_63242/g.193457 Transcript_63242/m.193457 type:complete len:390 (+) Transcript_63242:913-2082(+)